MADITPITREEFYLTKAGGQDVPVPSAVTREEYYLEKLTNDSVVVPSPVTRREKFLYFACGGEIDLPSEDRMTRLERLIAKAGGMDVSTPTAVTRFEKFWANVEGGGWNVTELTGTLPMTFRSNGTALIDYRIYGRTEGSGVQTENYFGDYESFPSTNLANVNVWTLYGDNGITQRVKCEGNTEYTLSFANSASILRISASSTNDVPTENNPVTVQRLVFTTNSSSETFTTPNDAKFIIVQISINEQVLLNTAMLVKGFTPPETFIPYGYKLPITVTSGADSKDTDIFIGDSKLGAEEYVDYGEQKMYKRTKNLINPDETSQGDGYIASHLLTAKGVVSGHNWTYITEFISVEAGTSYCIFRDIFEASNTSSNKRSIIAFYDADKNYIDYAEILYQLTRVEYDVTNCDVFSTPENCKYIRISIDRNSTQNMLIEDLTPPESYIPYLQPTDPPLTLHAIETFKGTNTLDSTETLGEVTIKGRIKEA